MTIDTLHVHRPTILELATLRGARNVRVFESTVRGDARPSSDIDFLVEIESGRTLLDASPSNRISKHSSAGRLKS
jgi:predicted nucleotidyltransferase